MFKTYFRYEDGRLIALDKVRTLDHIESSDYIEGAMEMVVNDVILISPELWDYIDQLWGYLVDAVEKAVSGEEASFYFPDQPILVSVQTTWNGAGLLIAVTIDKQKTQAAVDTAGFLASFTANAREFFARLIELVPERREVSLHYLQKVATIEARFAH